MPIVSDEWTILTDGSAPWDIINKRWTGSIPPKRYGHTILAIHNGFIVFGGADESTPYSDIWRFNLGRHIHDISCL